MNFCCSFSHLFWQLKNPGGLGSGIFQFLSVHSFFFFLSSNYTNSYSKKVNIIKLSYLCCVCVCVFWVLNMIFFFWWFFFLFLDCFCLLCSTRKDRGRNQRDVWYKLFQMIREKETIFVWFWWFIVTTRLMIVVQTKLYSFRFDCKIVSFTAANTNLIFSVSKKREIGR